MYTWKQEDNKDVQTKDVDQQRKVQNNTQNEEH